MLQPTCRPGQPAGGRLRLRRRRERRVVRSSTSMWQWTQTRASETQGSGDRSAPTWWTPARWKDRYSTTHRATTSVIRRRLPRARAAAARPRVDDEPAGAGRATRPCGRHRRHRARAPDGSVSVNAQNSVTNSEQLRQLSSRVVSPTNVPSTPNAAAAVERLPSNTRRTAAAWRPSGPSIPRIGDVTTTFTVASATTLVLAAVNAQGKMVP